MAGPLSKITEVTQGFVDYLNTRQQVIDLNLAGDGLAKLMRNQPQSMSSFYPCNPYTKTPALLIIKEDVAYKPRAASGGLVHEMELLLSSFYYRRQIPGEDNATAISQDIDNIISAFTLDKLMPPPLSAPSIPGFQLIACIPVRVTFHSDVYHDSMDPSLNISVAQINFRITGTISQY